MCRYPAWDQKLIRSLICVINMRLEADRRRRTEEAGGEIEALLASDPPLHKEIWNQIKGCYKAAYDHMMPPAQVNLKRITAECVTLYRQVTPPGENILINIEPFQMKE